MKKIIAFDFDGTLCEDEYPEIGKKRPVAFSLAKQAKEYGHTLILWTCRSGILLNEAIEFCKKNNLEFDYINENTKENIKKYKNDSRKIFADYYIDDKQKTVDALIKAIY